MIEPIGVHSEEIFWMKTLARAVLNVQAEFAVQFRFRMMVSFRRAHKPYMNCNDQFSVSEDGSAVFNPVAQVGFGTTRKENSLYGNFCEIQCL
jgi:hypothetical protein